MSTPLPDSLARFGEQLERAIERDRFAGRRRHRIAIRMLVTSAAAVAIAAAAASLPGDDARVSPPGVGTLGTVGTASAAERAAAALSVAPGSLVHDVASYRSVGPDGSVSTWRQESWRQTSRPYARRELTTREGGIRIETATVGDRPAELYDPATDTIYTNPPEGGPALGTPAPATDGDPLREQLLQMLRSDDASAPTRSTVDGRAAIRFTYRNPLPDGATVDWTYLVDAKTYEPIRLTTVSPGGGRDTVRFETYETLEMNDALLELRAQHPGAAVDRTEAGYQAAQARLSAGQS